MSSWRRTVKRLIGCLTAAIYLALLASSGFSQQQSNISGDSSQNSAQDSSKDSSQQSSQDSSDQSTANSSDSDSSAASSKSSSEESSANSSDGDSSGTVSLVVAGAVIVIAVAVTGVALTVKAKKAKEASVVGLQDQIYLAEGKDYEAIRDYFGLRDRDIATANDELVTAGYAVVDDKSAGDYLAALMLKCAERSDKVKAELAM
jgi:hypothetical protein